MNRSPLPSLPPNGSMPDSNPNPKKQGSRQLSREATLASVPMETFTFTKKE
jgi:hypothetical protein